MKSSSTVVCNYQLIILAFKKKKIKKIKHSSGMFHGQEINLILWYGIYFSA